VSPAVRHWCLLRYPSLSFVERAQMTAMQRFRRVAPTADCRASRAQNAVIDQRATGRPSMNRRAIMVSFARTALIGALASTIGSSRAQRPANPIAALHAPGACLARGAFLPLLTA